jgi:hypothetical protein
MKIGPLYLYSDMQNPSNGKLLAAWHRASSITWTWAAYWHPAWLENRKWRVGVWRWKSWNFVMGKLGSLNFSWQGRMPRQRTES